MTLTGFSTKHVFTGPTDITLNLSAGTATVTKATPTPPPTPTKKGRTFPVSILNLASYYNQWVTKYTYAGGHGVISDDSSKHHVTSESIGLGMVNAALILKLCQASTPKIDQTTCNLAQKSFIANYNMVGQCTKMTGLLGWDLGYLNPDSGDKSIGCNQDSGSATDGDLYILGAQQIILDSHIDTSNWKLNPQLTQASINTQSTLIQKNDFIDISNNVWVASNGANHEDQKLQPDKAILPLMQLLAVNDKSWVPFIKGNIDYVNYLLTTMMPSLFSDAGISPNLTNYVVIGGDDVGFWPKLSGPVEI